MVQTLRTYSAWLAMITAISVSIQFAILAWSHIKPEKQNDLYLTIMAIGMVDGCILSLGVFLSFCIKPSQKSIRPTIVTWSELAFKLFQYISQSVMHTLAWIITIATVSVLTFFSYTFLGVIAQRKDKMIHDVFEIWGSCVVLIMTLVINGVGIFLLNIVVKLLMRWCSYNSTPMLLSFMSNLVATQLWLPMLFIGLSSQEVPKNKILRQWYRFEIFIARPLAQIASYMFLSILCAAVFHEERSSIRWLQRLLNIVPFMRAFTTIIVSVGLLVNLVACLRRKRHVTGILFIVVCVVIDAINANTTPVPSKYANRDNVWIDHSSKMIIDFAYTTGSAKAVEGSWIVLTPYVSVAYNQTQPTFTNAALLGYTQADFDGTIDHEQGHSETKVFFSLLFAFIFVISFEDFDIKSWRWHNVRCIVLYIVSITAISWCDELVADMKAGSNVRSYVIRGWGTIGARSHPPGTLRFLAGDLGHTLFPLLQNLNIAAYIISVLISVTLVT
jgi:hypothetical protein